MILTTPCYGGCTVGYSQSFHAASLRRDAVRIVGGIQPSSSLLPTAFNECLARALTMRDAGTVTHMAMLHSDVSATPGWLDVLWAELWINNAVLVAANLAIKADGGRTSTAIGDRADRWRVHRSLYLKDLEKLPETFGPEHVCRDDEVLLVNTGCWLADLRDPFWDRFVEAGPDGASGFNIHGRITRIEMADGTREYNASGRSEDYELSHAMAAFGARYMVTRKVKTWHEGGGRWPNH